MGGEQRHYHRRCQRKQAVSKLLRQGAVGDIFNADIPKIGKGINAGRLVADAIRLPFFVFSGAKPPHNPHQSCPRMAQRSLAERARLLRLHSSVDGRRTSFETSL